MTENTQIVIRKNGVEIAIFEDPLGHIFQQVIQEIDESQEETLGETVIFKKNKRISFDAEQVLGFLHSVLYNMIRGENNNLFNICMGKKENSDEITETKINSFITYYGGVYYDMGVLENLLLSEIYSKKKGKKNDWTYCVEDHQVDFDDILENIYGDKEIDDEIIEENIIDDISE